MKKIIILLYVLFLISETSLANCPSESVYRANLHNVSDKNSYLKSVTSECITYFKSKNSPDCNKISTLFSAYMTMYNRDSAVYKPQIYGLKNRLSTFCPAEFDSVKDIIFK